MKFFKFRMITQPESQKYLFKFKTNARKSHQNFEKIRKISTKRIKNCTKRHLHEQLNNTKTDSFFVSKFLKANQFYECKK